MTTALDPRWIHGLRARANQPPLRPRVPLAWNGLGIGSVESELLAALELRGTLHRRPGHGEVTGALTPALAVIANALRDAGLVHAWRNEQLAVIDDNGNELGTVERGVARLLGIPTHAVHLLGFDAAGDHWLQRRALSKPVDPGLWDTLVGGMVPAGENAALALARETMEEAGLALEQVRDFAPGGTVTTQRPSATESAGYIIERLTWYRCLVPEGVTPVNRDGEVSEFRRMPGDEVVDRLQRDEFTIDAALMLLQAGV